MHTDDAMIQPPADEILDARGIKLVVEDLARSRFVSVERFGESRAGHPIEALIVTSEANHRRLELIRAAAARLSFGEDPGEDLPVPILMTASNYGSEAAQTEALLELVRKLVSDPSQESGILDNVVAIVLPSLNPDGRERALQIWRRTHLASAMSAFGNAFGIQVAREYLHLLEPETVALAELVRHWHPVLVWEIHEDAISLGRMLEQVCLAPPMASRADGARWIASRPGDLHHELWDQEAKYGALIAAEWSARGFHLLHSPTGENGWPVPLVDGYDSLAQHPETRFTRAMAMRGVTTFITESARTPGSQTWRDRVEQKVSAGLAIAHGAAADRSALRRIIRESVRVASTVEPEFYIIPADQDSSLLEHALDILLTHEVEVKAVGDEFVVSRAQPRGATAETLLDLERSRHQSLVASIGLRVIPTRTLPVDERRRWESVDGFLLEPRVAVVRALRSTRKRGAVVAVYGGQGVADYAAEGQLGGVERLLSGAGICYEILTALDIERGALDKIDVFIVPKGNLAAIRDGNRADAFWHSSPWEPEEPSRGVPAEAIREFVRRGGRYVGLDAGGGLLALELGLIDCELRSMNAGTGLVELQLTEAGRTVFASVGAWDVSGSWRPDVVHAITACEAWLGEDGGLIFTVGPGAHCLARYAAFLPVEGVAHLRKLEPGLDPSEWGAIARGRFGRGDVYVFGIDPTYRSLSKPAADLLLSVLSSR